VRAEGGMASRSLDALPLCVADEAAHQVMLVAGCKQHTACSEMPAR
jgi:hypothetical protein